MATATARRGIDVRVSERTPACVVARVRGAVADERSLHRLRCKLERLVALGPCVVLDLAGTDYLSSPALAALSWVTETCAALGGRCVLVGASARLEHLIAMLGLSDYLVLARTLPEAKLRARKLLE